MKKTLTRLFAAFLVLVSLCATIHLQTISRDLSSSQSEILKVLPEEAPTESILPEVQVVKTILQKFIEL